ncbi:uncharacterized protein LOC142168399 [Nicotiana tabacum]|uniref:Uncharacterized protein LOC142168399 n=1 Tax=Nicotiana tabacum TaxID=4097 RepID=A0AC58SJP0_TOBAC
MSHDELFKETHIVKKKKEGDGDRWVEDQAETAYGRYQSNVKEFIRSQPAGELGEPIQPSDEDAERIWLEAVGGPKRGKVYGLPTKKFHRYRYGMQGIGDSSQGEELNRERLSAMRETVSKLTSELEAAKERESLRDAQFLDMQAQIRTLLSSGAFPLPRSRESSPEARPPRDRSSRPPRDRSSGPPRDRSSHPPQDRSLYRLVDESSSDGDNVVENTL